MGSRQKRNLRVIVRLTKELYDNILQDLKRPHSHASERVGFCYSKIAVLSDNEFVLLLTKYDTVDDWDYVRDSSVGAHINSDAIQKSMQKSITESCGVFHTHMHWGSGIPEFSSTDMRSLPRVANCFRVGSQEAHGLFLLNYDSLNCLIWLPGIENPVYAHKISIIGYPISFFFPRGFTDRHASQQRYDRQSFLGENSQMLLQNTKIGIVGLGGGGSHVMQQLAHLGIGSYVLLDPDTIEESNLNRMVGSNQNDVNKKKAKADIAKRVIKAVLPEARVSSFIDNWENHTDDLHSCDLVVGCLDTVAGRRDLEAECRRYLVPLIDIGMDVYRSKEGYDIRGQVIVSMPGDLCFQCFEFITEENLKKEAEKYGAAGGQPQVVWSNGVLASTALGLMADLITGWSRAKGRRVYLSYNGNLNTLKTHTREEYPLNDKCKHYKTEEAGPPLWRK